MLINVLVILALTATMVFVMITTQDAAIGRAQIVASSSRAMTLARGIEASVIVALRRDMLEAPDADHLGEAWADVTQEEVSVSGGRISVDVTDAQARFNLNLLTRRSVQDFQRLSRLAAVLDLSDTLAPRIARAMARRGVLVRLTDLGPPDVSAEELAALRPYVDMLPLGATINLNTADPLLLRVLLNNRAATARLLRLREREGEITKEAVTKAGAVVPSQTGFTSDLYDMVATVEFDGAEVMLTSRLQRQPGGGVDVLVRRLGYFGD